MSEEDFEVGRKIGLVARKNRALYDQVKQIAKQKKMKLQDVMSEALELWTMYSTMEQVDPKALVVAMSFIEHMLTRSVTLLVQLGQLFTSEMMRSVLEIVAQSPAPSTPAQAETIAEKPASPYKSEIMKALMPVLTQMLLNILLNTIRAMYPQVAQSTPSIPLAQQQSLPTQQLRQVKVEE